MRTRLAWLLAGVLALGACGGGDATESEEYAVLSRALTAMETERDELVDRVEELETTNSTLLAEAEQLHGEAEAREAGAERLEAQRDQAIDERDDAISERDALIEERDDVISERDAALAELDEAAEDVRELRELLDPKIQAALAVVTQSALDAACAAGDAAGFNGTEPPAAVEIIARAAAGLPRSERELAIEHLERRNIDAKVRWCHAVGAARKTGAAPTTPHPDGLAGDTQTDPGGRADSTAGGESGDGRPVPAGWGQN